MGVSNRITYDPLLVRYLAEELDGVLRGRACAAAPLFAPDLSVSLPVEGGRELRLDLHPSRGWVRMLDGVPDDAPTDSRCTRVEAPPDERALVIHLSAPDRFGAGPRRLVVELHTNQWNAALVSDESDRILSILRARTAGSRSLRPGATYEPPAGEPRFGAFPLEESAAWEVWRERLGPLPEHERRAALLRGFAYAGTPNVEAILGPASAEHPHEDEETLRRAFERWWAIVSLPPAEPVLLSLPSGPLPYPLPLPGVPSAPVPSVLEGMTSVAAEEERSPAGDEASTIGPLLAAAARRVEGLERRVARLREELASAGAADRLRGWGDLLLAKLREVPRGVDQVIVDGWEGEPTSIPLDPALSPAENAARLYDEARKRGRAEDRLPGLIEEALQEIERWRAAIEGAEGEGLPVWAVEALSRALGREASAGETEGEARPYRVYRTAGGLEVRVGRSARANDRLTFSHSSPNDVWLHAQSVPGSHVILRWPDPEASPPAHDLEEAAVLAARYSRARTSTVVAVDWTRRKYVRKPRGAPPGSVVLQRARTLFVEPDPAVEERMRLD